MTQKIESIDAQFSNLPHIDVAELKKLPPDSYVLVDVRKKEEIQVSTLPRATDWETFQKNSQQHKDKLIVPYCTIGYRSALITDSLLKMDFKAKNLRGSILSWVWAGGNLVIDDQATKKLHVYGKEWDLVPEGYQSQY